MALDSKIPNGPISDKWTNYKDHINLVNPANKRNLDIIVVGTGLAGGSAAATLAELGYNVKAFVFKIHPSCALYCCTRRINAAKNYQGRRFRFPIVL
jgi:succinate dehydrogenase / fumarate reductase flavoprotein subunit